MNEIERSQRMVARQGITGSGDPDDRDLGQLEGSLNDPNGSLGRQNLRAEPGTCAHLLNPRPQNVHWMLQLGLTGRCNRPLRAWASPLRHGWLRTRWANRSSTRPARETTSRGELSSIVGSRLRPLIAPRRVPSGASVTPQPPGEPGCLSHLEDLGGPARRPVAQLLLVEGERTFPPYSESMTFSARRRYTAACAESGAASIVVLPGIGRRDGHRSGNVLYYRCVSSFGEVYQSYSR